MKIKTSATLFSGCEGVGLGLRQAGLSHLWGIEKHEPAAKIAKANEFNTLIQDVTSTDWAKLDRPDWLHASPPCQNASIANSKKGETGSDMLLAQAVIKAIEVLQPEVFSLENVIGYAYFESFHAIQNALKGFGYESWAHVLSSESYGVPQTRERLFLVARKGCRPLVPRATYDGHIEFAGLFGDRTLPVVGWAEALKGLPEPEQVELTPRITDSIPPEFTGTALFSGFKDSGVRKPTIRLPFQCASTITASMQQPSTRPHIITRDMQGNIKAQVLGVAHMAALQGVPPDFEWGEENPEVYRAIGNAVPPPMMEAIVKANL